MHRIWLDYKLKYSDETENELLSRSVTRKNIENGINPQANAIIQTAMINL